MWPGGAGAGRPGVAHSVTLAVTVTVTAGAQAEEHVSLRYTEIFNANLHS